MVLDKNDIERCITKFVTKLRVFFYFLGSEVRKAQGSWCVRFVWF
jgi:hypothetical protein